MGDKIFTYRYIRGIRKKHRDKAEYNAERFTTKYRYDLKALQVKLIACCKKIQDLDKTITKMTPESLEAFRIKFDPNVSEKNGELNNEISKFNKLVIQIKKKYGSIEYDKTKIPKVTYSQRDFEKGSDSTVYDTETAIQELSKIHVIDGLLHDVYGRCITTGSRKRGDHDREESIGKDGSGLGIYVMSEHGDIHVSKRQERGYKHHSTLLAGAPIAAAGEMKIKDGKLLLLNNTSGHYKPDQYCLLQVLHSLQKQEANLDDLEIVAGVVTIVNGSRENGSNERVTVETFLQRMLCFDNLENFLLTDELQYKPMPAKDVSAELSWNAKYGYYQYNSSLVSYNQLKYYKKQQPYQRLLLELEQYLKDDGYIWHPLSEYEKNTGCYILNSSKSPEEKSEEVEYSEDEVEYSEDEVEYSEDEVEYSEDEGEDKDEELDWLKGKIGAISLEDAKMIVKEGQKMKWKVAKPNWKVAKPNWKVAKPNSEVVKPRQQFFKPRS